MPKFEYASYLRVTKDGYIWWRLEDAIRLGAGFHPFADDHAVLVTELRASNNRAKANERTLIGAFSDDRLNIERPMTIERDGSHFVDASAFLTWLSQYIAQTQAKIAFPNDLVREVRNAKAEAASSRTEAADTEFVSLTLALEAWFDQPRDALPDELSQRVQKEFFVPWDALKPALRRDVALRWDYQNDPATQEDRRFWWDFCQRMDAIEQQIREWEASSAPTASDLAQKETRLKELREELARMDLQKRQPGKDYYPARTCRDETKEAQAADAGSKVTYIPYPRAMKILAKRLGATPEEMAAWVLNEHIGGGLDAFLNANELNPPPKFDYTQCIRNDDECDYHSPLMACWFKEDEIAQFEPANRYMTGKTLIERWSQYPEIQPHAYIYAKIYESRLMGRHPILGLVQGTNRNSSRTSPLETALFKLADVEDIELEDFGVDEPSEGGTDSPCQPVQAWEIRHRFRVLRDEDANEEWWKYKMANPKRSRLLECRVGEGKKGPGGSLWRPHLVAAWLVDRKANGHEGLDSNAVRAALKKFPGCKDVADKLFPPEI